MGEISNVKQTATRRHHLDVNPIRKRLLSTKLETRGGRLKKKNPTLPVHIVLRTARIPGRVDGLFAGIVAFDLDAVWARRPGCRAGIRQHGPILQIQRLLFGKKEKGKK